MRSTIISRCSSPIPEINVWPVSSSVCTRNVGSSCASLRSAVAHFFLIRLGFWFDRNGNNGGGKIDGFSRTIGLSSSQSVSPVVTFFSPHKRRCHPLRSTQFPRACSRACAADGPCARAFCASSCKPTARFSGRRNKRGCKSRGRRTGSVMILNASAANG